MTIEEFQKIDLRVGKVIHAEPVSDSEKLLKLEVNIGAETRQIVAGIGKAYTPESLVGREIVLVANLESRMLMGFESQGMLLAASREKEEPVLLTLDKEVLPGSKVK